MTLRNVPGEVTRFRLQEGPSAAAKNCKGHFSEEIGKLERLSRNRYVNGNFKFNSGYNGAWFDLSSWHGLKEGDEVELEIKETSRRGDGVGRADGCIVFVEGAKAGEKVKVRITQCAARHARAEIVKRLQ